MKTLLDYLYYAQAVLDIYQEPTHLKCNGMNVAAFQYYDSSSGTYTLEAGIMTKSGGIVRYYD